ncbi:hypothetical protein [Noviherbaspirillum cavernae]|uniref:hypothetical protein n=1 Tax=Noviherbaspirillum cavernae TaxID=2320862 RepID=UPI0011C3F660|nr:hypothetical protein [Noviherbaspirillum cavernae]
MKTAAISNPANVNSATASSAKQSGDASGLPFSELLSREVADRGAVNEAAMPATAKAAPPRPRRNLPGPQQSRTKPIPPTRTPPPSPNPALPQQARTPLWQHKARPSLPPTTQRKPRRPHWQPHPRNCSPWLPT